jgi:hypothetical protein
MIKNLLQLEVKMKKKTDWFRIAQGVVSIITVICYVVVLYYLGKIIWMVHSM